MTQLESHLLPHPMKIVAARIVYPLPEAYLLADCNSRIVNKLAREVEDLMKLTHRIAVPNVIVSDILSFTVYPDTDLSKLAREISVLVEPERA